MITVTETGTSCNDYKNDGKYWFGSNAVLPTERPANIYGWLEVISSGGSNIKQLWHRSSTINGSSEYQTFVRLYNINAQAWSAWSKYQMVEDSGWITPTLINGAHSSNVNYLCQYRKINGVVYLRGVITGITGACNLFELPTGYRPIGYQRFLKNSSNNLMPSNLIYVGVNGVVDLRSTSETGTFQITLDGISFVADY